MRQLTLVIICLALQTTSALDDDNVISSTNYPQNYPDNENSANTVSVLPGYNILITFHDFQLEADDSCERDYFQVCDKGKKNCGHKLCGISLPEPIIYPASTASFVFHSNGNNARKGFQLSYKKVKPACSENVEISEDCVCFNKACGVTSTCVDGKTCTPVCHQNEQISEECLCANVLCGANSSCINGTTCLPACTENVEISEDCVCSNEVCEISYVCASGKTCSKGWELVTDLEKQIPEFLFDCLRNKDPWISPCSTIRKYFMLFDSHGNFLRQKVDQTDNSLYLSASYMKKTRRPAGKQIIELEAHPDFLFQLEVVDKIHGSFYIGTNTTGTAQLLVAGNGESPSQEEDYCNGTTAVTESPVTVASIDTPSSTEPPVTAIAISTSAPNIAIDYSCNQAQWRLWKVDGRFLLIESANKPGLFLNVEPKTHKVRLGMPEKLTGIYTSFISNITLDRSAGLQAEQGIGAEAYGDLVVHYIERDGSQHSGYVCDSDWGQESADAVCKHLGFETGIPTYDGQYSSTNTPEYVVSELECDSENVEECKVRTICGPSDESCLAQNSMKAFGGKGYACNFGMATDVAGVVCGDQNQISNLIKEELSCNETTLGNDQRSVAGMFTIQKQITQVSSKMFENKHWSEYLLPMPMTVSLMSALLLVSSANDRDIELVKPSSGKWDYLKFDNIMGNLLFLSHNIKEDFMLSNSNMGVIKVNTRHIGTNMQEALQNVFSSNKYDYKIALKRNLKRIAEDAEENKEKAAQVQTAFNHTNQIIDELLQALTATKGYHQNKNVDSEKAINITKTLYERDQKEYEVKMLDLEKYDAAVKESRNTFFKEAEKAMKSQCVNGDTECANCAWIEPMRTEQCKPGKSERVCVEYDDPICLEEEDICTQHRKKCENYENYCYSDHWLWGCQGYGRRCQSYENPCVKRKTICKKNAPNAECKRYESFCNDYVYSPVVSGSYCQDSGTSGECSRCKWIDEISKNLKNVGDISNQLQQSVMNGETSYSGVTGVMADLVSQLEMIDRDVQNYKNWTDTSFNNITEAASNDTEPTKLEQAAKRNIESTLKLIKLSVDMDVNLLSQMKIPIAKKSYSYALAVNTFLEELIEKKRFKVEHMTNDEKMSVTTFLRHGEDIRNEATELQSKHEVAIEKDPASGSSAADVKTGKHAQILVENLVNRHKTEKQVESLTNRMSSAIRDMFKQQVEKQDINSIITKLVQCSRYLNLLSKQWIDLRIFFEKLATFLKIQHKSIKEMSEMYTDIGVNIPREDLSKTFKKRLQRGIIESMANNIFVGRIAYFYTKIAEGGLLTEMASIGQYMEDIEDPAQFERLKKFIEDEAMKIQEKIKLEVSKEEGRIRDKILKEVTSMRNQLACKMKNAKELPADTYIALKSTEKAMNGHTNIMTATSNATTVEIEEIISDAPPLDLDKTGKEIENNELGEPDKEDIDYYW